MTWFMAASLVVHALALVLIIQYGQQTIKHTADSMMVRLMDEPRPKPSPMPIPPAAHRASPFIPPAPSRRGATAPAPRPAYPVVPFPSSPAPQAVAPVVPLPSSPELAPSRPEGAVKRGAARPKIDFSDIPRPSRGASHDETRLVDRSVIQQYAEKAEQKEEAQKKVGISTDDFKYRDYMMRLKARIESVWGYPREAAERGISGDLIVEFLINKDGSLGSVRLARTSGFPDLDEAALRAVRAGAPYWPMPAEWEEKGIVVVGHFIYEGRSDKQLK